jgi:hypothetical protein
MPGASLMMRFFESPPRESRSASGPGTEADYQQGGGEDPGALRAATPAGNCLDHHVGIEAGFKAERDGLADGRGVYGDQQIVDELDLAGRAKGTEVKAYIGKSRCPSSRWATANLPVAKRILAATDKSIAWLADPSHRDEAIELLVKVARSSIEDAEPQRDCGPARNQSAWRHEAQAARRPGSQCRRHLLRTRVGASRAIRAQSG